MSENKTKLIIGRVVELDDHRQGVVPLSNQLATHGVEVLEYQRHVAALITAAYLFRAEETEKTLNDLARAARAL
jgi:hypothetical protein